MFPEGTTTNGTSIVKFRSGAFVAGVPVVPTVFKYPFKFFDPAFSSVSLKWHLLGTMSQLINFMEVEYMPVYYPSEEEKKVRQVQQIVIKMNAMH
jgi:lysophosphatidylcholine acyltransferase/lyso-PAF acetyltransferase